jgi:hypothetical protein
MCNDEIEKTIYSNGKTSKSVTVRRDTNKHSYSVFMGKRQAVQLKAQMPY